MTLDKRASGAPDEAPYVPRDRKGNPYRERPAWPVVVGCIVVVAALVALRLVIG